MLAITTTHLVGLLTGLFLPANNAQAQQAPAAGMFLIASRNLRGSGFEKSVILIIQHDRDGTVGLIINQPTGTNPAELLPEVTGLRDTDSKLYIGGPVAAWGVIMLINSSRAPSRAEHVFGNVYTSGDFELLNETISSGVFATHVRLYAGHAGWIPGQLDAEIRRGSWFVVPAKMQFIFSTQPDRIWQELISVSDHLIVKTVSGLSQKYTYNVTSPQMMPVRSGHFSNTTP